MKKVYSKPRVLFESFSLCTNIATTCGVISDDQAQGQCGFKWSQGRMLFTSAAEGCTKIIIDGDATYNGLCYHVPTDDKALFNS